MDGRLACQTDETADARALYDAGWSDCEDCATAWLMRGATMALAESDDAEVEGDMTSLARAVLALGRRAEARAVTPAAAHLRDANNR